MEVKKRKVLIVDDDTLIRSQLEKELKRNFFDVVLAKDGQETKSYFEPISGIDIVLLDVQLPDASGLDLLKFIKEKQPDCEAIMITGYGNTEVAIQSLRNGATDYIEKPIDMEDLNAAFGRASEKLQEKEDLSYQNTVLIIDDEEVIVERMKRFLRKEDFNVFGAYSGKQGLEIIENQKIDVVVTDINMPGMDGIEVLKRAKNFYTDIEVIMVTGYRDEELSIKSLRAGAFDYITKPINLDQLMYAVERAIKVINLNRTRLYRNRELKISSKIIAKMNEELERRIEERTEELNKVQGQLFQTSKLATLGEMAAGLAHEINQPLGGISLVCKTFRKLLQRDRLTDEELKEGFDDIDLSIQRINRIINHIRTFARQDTFKFAKVNINDTINGALSLLGEQLRLREIDVAFQPDPSLPNIYGEAFQLEQVWINFIANARDAMIEKQTKIANGQLDIPSYEKMIVIQVIEKSDSLVVHFKDNGIGMSNEIKNKVFDPFFTTKEVGKGTGLGLSISYGIIESHKGKIDFYSEENIGTEIKVYLPLKPVDNESV